MIIGICIGMIIMILFAQTYNFCCSLMNRKYRIKAMRDEIDCYKKLISDLREERTNLLNRIKEMES